TRLRSPREGFPGFCGGAVRMTARDGHASLTQQIHQLVGTRKLGRERHVAHRAGVEEASQQPAIRVAPRLRRTRAEPLRGNERTFEMRTDDVRVGTILRNLV